MSATDELRRLLDERGVEYKGHYMNTSWHAGTKLHMATDDMDGTLTVDSLTPGQAVAATLSGEPPYDELLRCLENDWNISASWDGLRKFWCIELTEEGVRLRDVEPNSRAERTCRIEGRYGNQYCTCCGEMVGTWDSTSELYIDGNIVELWNYCPNCGAKVVGK